MRTPKEDEEVIYVAAYRNRAGKLMVAAHYGLKAWRFVVKRKK